MVRVYLHTFVFFEIRLFEPLNRKFRAHRVIHEIDDSHGLCCCLFIDDTTAFACMDFPFSHLFMDTAVVPSAEANCS